MNYYIADLHLGHANAIRFDNQPFADVDEKTGDPSGISLDNLTVNFE